MPSKTAPSAQRMVSASEFKCCVCKRRKAVAFWPCVDPDIRSHPYCESCLKTAHMALMIELAMEGVIKTKVATSRKKAQ